MHFRVIPRDLFNEAKLMKCLGLLTLRIHDSIGLSKNLHVNHEDSAVGFPIKQNPLDGSISCSNLYFFDNHGTPIYVYSLLNSKLNYPLCFDFNEETDFVFDDEGEFSEEFKGLFCGLD